MKHLAAAATIALALTACSPDVAPSAPLYGVGDSLASGFGGESWVAHLDRPAETAGWAGAGFTHRGMEAFSLPNGLVAHIAINGRPEQVVIVAGVNDAVGPNRSPR